MRTKTPMIALCVFPAILAAFSGCSKKDANRSAIGGAVTLDGKPIEQGSIMFIPIDGAKGAATGGQIAKGRYQIASHVGAAVGRNRVEVRAVHKTGRMIPRGFGATGKMIEEQSEGVATHFNSASTLTIEIKPDDNVGNFEVTSK